MNLVISLADNINTRTQQEYEKRHNDDYLSPSKPSQKASQHPIFQLKDYITQFSTKSCKC